MLMLFGRRDNGKTVNLLNTVIKIVKATQMQHGEISRLCEPSFLGMKGQPSCAQPNSPITPHPSLLSEGHLLGYGW